ncbi:MAG: TetR/AcrR family transcriptional regulator [Gemmatimonadaceae bacterium]
MTKSPAVQVLAGPAKAKSALSVSRADTEHRFLDAAERLLVDIGYAAITARRLADEAAANLGLIHYYFGSMEELFLQVLERFTAQLIARQRAMYSAPGRYIDKWREAMRYLNEDRPYQKIWWELQAMAWNRPEFRPRVARVHRAWCDAMRGAVAEALKRYKLDDDDFSTEAWITLIVTVNEGIILERLSGIDRGHKELLAAIDTWLESKEKKAARR